MVAFKWALKGMGRLHTWRVCFCVFQDAGFHHIKPVTTEWQSQCKTVVEPITVIIICCILWAIHQGSWWYKHQKINIWLILDKDIWTSNRTNVSWDQIHKHTQSYGGGGEICINWRCITSFNSKWCTHLLNSSAAVRLTSANSWPLE